MKQDILCMDCAKERRELHKTDNPYPGEHIKFVLGEARKDMLCDGCVTERPIVKGEEVCAYSSWADYGGIPYYKWETQFIKLNNKTL